MKLSVVIRTLLLCSLGCADRTGREILFASTSDPASDSATINVFAIRGDGTGLRQLTHGTKSERTMAVWSPDEKLIAFIADSANTLATLHLMDPDGSNQRLLVRLDSMAVSFPDWSPDGSRILFNASRGAVGPQSPRNVYLVNRDGSGLQPVLADSSAYGCPTWFPDGQAFLVSSLVHGVSRIVRVTLATRASEVLITSDSMWLGCPSVSPDGNRLVFNGSRLPIAPSPVTHAFQMNIYVANRDGSGFRPLTTGAMMTNDARWSRDGRIVVQSNRHAPAADSPLAALDSLDIYVMNGDGSNIVRVTTNSRFDGHPSW